MEKERYEQLAKIIFISALEVHKQLGPGLLESTYHHALAYELKMQKISVKSEVKVPLFYKGMITEKDFFIDLLVDDEIIIELKAVDVLLPLHTAQLISYLKLADKRMGFLINFNVPLIKEGFRRIVNQY
jgi:GxxExxY protein